MKQPCEKARIQAVVITPVSGSSDIVDWGISAVRYALEYRCDVIVNSGKKSVPQLAVSFTELMHLLQPVRKDKGG